MSLYKYYRAIEVNILPEGFSDLERRIKNYCPRKLARASIGPLVGSRRLSTDNPEDNLSLIYHDSSRISSLEKGRKKYWLFGKRKSNRPAIYSLQFVIKSNSEDRIREFESNELGLGNEVLFNLGNLYSLGTQVMENRQVCQAAFSFVVPDAESLSFEFDRGKDQDYLSEFRSRLLVELPEEDYGGGLVSGNIEPVLELRGYLLDHFQVGLQALVFE